MTLDTSAVRGFNYQPSYSAHLQYTWTHFDPEVWAREVPYARRFGSNVLRLWLTWSAWLVLEDELLERFDRALGILDANGLRAMPVLFNRWNDALYPAGMVTERDLLQSDYGFAKFRPYVDAMAQCFSSDERIACWDLCNEPQAPNCFGGVNDREIVWLQTVAERVRRCSDIPITIGTMAGDNVRIYAPVADILSFHPYPREIGQMEGACQTHLALAAEYGKPLLATETCCGALDDQERGALAKDNLETLERHGIGWVAWQLVSGKFTTGSRERTDCNAVRPHEGYMPFVLPDGSTRPGHEWLERS